MSVGACYSSVGEGVVAIPCVVFCGRWVIVSGHSPFCEWAGCWLWVVVVVCGCWVLFMGAGSLFMDPTLSFRGGQAGGADVHGWVVCGHGGAMQCVLCPALTVSETSVGRVLTFDNLNNDK